MIQVSSHTLRLVVTDHAILDCNGALHNRSEYSVSVRVGPLGDINCDGVVYALDIEYCVRRVISGDCDCP